jgi:hypothetical protein
MNFEPVLLVPHDVRSAPGLGAHIVLTEDAPGGEQQRKARTGALVGRHIFRDRPTGMDRRP